MTDRDASDLTHLDEQGRARMVDVGEKAVTRRRAVASGRLRLRPATLARIREGAAEKGDVLAVARIAGIQAAKETARWIPLCHPLPLDSVEIHFDEIDDTTLSVRAEARTSGRTGVEMEALTAVSAALLTVYDMVKAIDRGMVIERVQLEEKEGGRSGRWLRENDAGE
ncbi:MAG: cyclic pyranopterin monophosphate synthase MoaC [Planctomycetes bacterium]|nr:cyclic pyranopterin monophosphate synthase MoaC [Planctomycetota bacterium]